MIASETFGTILNAPTFKLQGVPGEKKIRKALRKFLKQLQLQTSSTWGRKESVKSKKHREFLMDKTKENTSIHILMRLTEIISTIISNYLLGMQNEAGQRLIEFGQENALVIVNSLFQQHKRRLYTWTSPDGQHQNQIDYILCSQRWRSFIQSTKTRPGADCGSDHELLITNSDSN